MSPLLSFLLPVAAVAAIGGEDALSPVALSTRPFFLGREYFVLRSGRAQLIVQADQADLGPALTYLLFDAEEPRQSARKGNALNFESDRACAASALAVVLGGFAFTSLGHRTRTHWTMSEGVPCVEAVWWAGGVRVTERISALAEPGAFHRSIRLEAVHLGGPDKIAIRLSLPRRPNRRVASALAQASPQCDLAIACAGDIHTTADESAATLTSGPLPLAPGQAASIDTLLVVGVPGGDAEKAGALAAKLAGGGLGPALDQARRRWKLASSVNTDEAVVREIFDKARFGLPGMVADNGVMNAGIFEYGAQWVRDTSNTVLGALHAGHFELAREALQFVLKTMVRNDGVTMIANSFDEPDREQFDQMGELMHVLKAYRDWTGDDSLIRAHRDALLAMIERPLDARFRDQTGMVHNRREFWERVLSDGYELAYQVYVVQGLRDAASLSSSLGAEDRAERWRTEADGILKAMLSHPTRSLVDSGRLVKRRTISGEVALRSDFPGFQPDTPAVSEANRLLLPDATQALPIAMGLVDARSDLARRTLDELEGLWNTRWSDGGYDRYHTSGQPDQPGPWPFATCFIMRAQHEAGLFDRSRRSLEWLNSVQGGRAGAWFEEIPSARSTQQACGLVPWTSGEVALFVVRHLLGVSFDGDSVVVRPALYPGGPPLSADLRFRSGRLRIDVEGGGTAITATVNGQESKADVRGVVRLQASSGGAVVRIRTSK